MAPLVSERPLDTSRAPRCAMRGRPAVRRNGRRAPSPARVSVAIPRPRGASTSRRAGRPARHIATPRVPMRSINPRIAGVRSLPSPFAALLAMCSARSPLRSSSGTIRRTDSRNRSSEATGACKRRLRSTTVCRSSFRSSMIWSRCLITIALSRSPDRSESVAAARLSVTSAKSCTTFASMSSNS